MSTKERTVSLEGLAALDQIAALALTLVDGVGLSVEFVAVVLGKSEAKTLRILARARKRLAELHGGSNGST